LEDKQLVNGGYVYAEMLSREAAGSTVLGHLVCVHTHSGIRSVKCVGT
jgi:mannitol/fructose-specific phosphotransferase system IIA component